MTYCTIPVKGGEDDEGVPQMKLVDHPVLLPHDLAAALFEAGYSDLLLDRNKFWNHMFEEYRDMHCDPKNTIPLCIYGDEVTVFRQACMCFHWQSLVSKHRTNSMASRFLIAIVPSEMYWIEEKVNKTLQVLAGYVVKSLNQLAWTGVQLQQRPRSVGVKISFIVMSFRGDWKYLR